MSSGITEADVENIAIGLFHELGYLHLFGPDITPDISHAERNSYKECHLPQRLL